MVLHALFGNEQDSCCNHQAAADHIEDGGADAAGAGQGGMGDYRTILRFAKEQKPYVFATLENTTPPMEEAFNSSYVPLERKPVVTFLEPVLRSTLTRWVRPL